jgi:Tol biopolymer transport system component
VIGTIALSPDGSKLASLVDRKGTTLVSVFDFTTGKSTVLETTKDATFPFWSPDGRSIGFFAKGKLRRVDAGGGAAQVLADAHEGRGGSWNEAGVIIFAPDIRGPLMRVSANGGPVAAVTKPATEALTHRNPLFLPGGKRFLFIERESRTEPFGRLMSGALDGAAPKVVLERASNAQFADGRLLFARDRTLLAQRFDPETLSLTGAISPIAENLDYWNPRDIANFSASRSGLVAFRHEVSTESTLAWFDRDGRLVDTLVPPSQFSVSSVSDDLRQIAISRIEAGAQTNDLWIVDASSKQTRRATFTNSPSQINGVFSPDGQRLAVTSLTSVSGGGAKGAGWAASALWLQPVTGVRTDKTLLEAAEFIIEGWSPDGKILIGTSQRTGTSFDLTWVAVDDAKPEVRDFVKTAYDERGARFSPDGRWVAYISNESARYEVYLLDFPGGTRKFQVSRDGGGPPTWSSDGREIYFAQLDGATMAVGVKLGEQVEIGTPVRLGLSDAHTSRPFASDGKRFLVTQESSRGADAPVRVIRNWAAGLPE